MKDSKIKNIITLVISFIVVAGVIIGMQFLVGDTIQKNKEEKITKSIYSFFPDSNFSVLYSVSLNQNESKYIKAIYEVKDVYDTVTGYCFLTTTSGEGDDLEMITGVDLRSTISGIEILSHSESPIKWNEKLDIDLIPKYFTGAGIDSVNELSVINGKDIVPGSVLTALNAIASVSTRLLDSGE